MIPINNRAVDFPIFRHRVLQEFQRVSNYLLKKKIYKYICIQKQIVFLLRNE